MKIFTKSLFALALIAATPALADDNQVAQVFERAASHQNATSATSSDLVAFYGTTAKSAAQSDQSNSEMAYRGNRGN